MPMAAACTALHLYLSILPAAGRAACHNAKACSHFMVLQELCNAVATSWLPI